MRKGPCQNIKKKKILIIYNFLIPTFKFFCSHIPLTNLKKSVWFVAVLDKTPENTVNSQENKQVDHQTSQHKVLTQDTNDQVQLCQILYFSHIV